MTNEEKIKSVLKPLIDEMKEKFFIDPRRETDEETLGIILAKYLDWDGAAIETVALAAFEDANFRHVKIQGL